MTQQTLQGSTTSADSNGPLESELPLDVIQQLNKNKEIKSLIDWVHQQYQAAKSARLSIERQWYLNMSFYYGKQNVTFLKGGTGVTAGKLVTPPAPPYRVRSVTNRIRPIIRTELSRVTSNKPSASCVPASSEDEDLFAAQAAEQIWESLYTRNKISRVFTRSMFWTLLCGTGFLKTWWDPNKVVPGQDQKGDICYAPVTPFHLFVPDLTEEEIENQPWVLNAYTKPVEWVKAVYGKAVSPSTVSSDEIVMEGFLDLGGGKKKPDSVLVLEMWMKPGAHSMFPNGGYVTLVDREIVSLHESLFYDHKEYPFTKFDHIPTGKFYAESVLTDLIGLQREYNRTRSQIIEAKNRMAKPQLMAPRGSVDASKITSEPGILIQYRPGLAPPQPLPLQPLPNYVLEELDRTVGDMEDISSQHAVSKGQAPTGVTAATAISYLQERDDSVMSTTYDSVEAGYEKIAKQSLSHVVQFWDVPRMIRTTGVDGSFDSISLKGSQIASGTDIRVEGGSSLPISKAGRQAFIMDLMKGGFIPPDKGLKLMEIGGVQRLYEEMAIDERQAQRENLRMRNLKIEEIESRAKELIAQQNLRIQMEQAKQQVDAAFAEQQGQQQQQSGQPPIVGAPDPSSPQDQPLTPEMQNQLGPQIDENIIPVNSWDNHQTHIEIHNRYRKSQSFELLPDPVKAQFEAHVQMHAMALNQSAMAAQMMMGGDPNAAGQIGSGMQGADNGSGTPLGMNQFGPPGTTDGNPPPDSSNSAPAGPPSS